MFTVFYPTIDRSAPVFFQQDDSREDNESIYSVSMIQTINENIIIADGMKPVGGIKFCYIDNFHRLRLSMKTRETKKKKSQPPISYQIKR